jgi:hypothetical protein
VHEGQLRDHFVLVKVELTPLSRTPRGNWRETWQQALETLSRCVYVDKDLVLPPMGGAVAGQTFFVVASTDLERSGIMMARIRGQLERNQELQASATLVISAVPVDFAAPPAGASLNNQVHTVTNRVTEIIMASMVPETARRGNGHASSNSVPKTQSIQKESSKCPNRKS